MLVNKRNYFNNILMTLLLVFLFILFLCTFVFLIEDISSFINLSESNLLKLEIIIFSCAIISGILYLILLFRSNDNLNYDTILFEKLRIIRRQLAEKNSVPPFIIFSDVTLKQMCTYYPQTKEEMLNISGVGIHKFENYGNDFIVAIRKYVIKKMNKPKII